LAEFKAPDQTEIQDMDVETSEILESSESQSSEEEDTRTAIPFGNIDDEIFMLPGIEQVAHFTIDAVSNRLNNGNKISYYLK
jgi:hypothetical protein